MQFASRPVVVLTAIFLVGIVALNLSSPPEAAWAQSDGLPTGNGLQMVSTPLPTGVQQIVILDENERTLAVYQIDPNQGKVALKSVRRLTHDLAMEEFNAQSPTPSELRKITR